MKIRNYKRMNDKNLQKEYDLAKFNYEVNYCVLLMEEINMRKKPEEVTAPKKYLDSKKLIHNALLYLRKYDVKVIELRFDALTHITQIVLPHSKGNVTDKEFCEWYLNTADIQAIAKSLGTALKKNKAITLAKDKKGHVVAIVNPAILKGGK